MMPQQVNLFTMNTVLWEGDGAISLVRSSPAVPSHQILYFLEHRYVLLSQNFLAQIISNSLYWDFYRNF